MRRLAGDEGASLVEYALAVVLIAVVALGAIGFVGDEVSGMFGDAGTALDGGAQPVTSPANPQPTPTGPCAPPPGNGFGWTPPKNCP